MKKIAILLISCFCMYSVSFAQDNQEKKTGPDIQFDKLVHDFGQVMQDDNTECAFVFKNTGNEPLILSNVQSSCGCTVPSWPKTPILPGQSEKITVKYNSHNVGPINKQITVLSNSPNSPTVLRIAGTVNSKPAEIMPVQPESSQPVPVPVKK